MNKLVRSVILDNQKRRRRKGQRWESMTKYSDKTSDRTVSGVDEEMGGEDVGMSSVEF